MAAAESIEKGKYCGYKTFKFTLSSRILRKHEIPRETIEQDAGELRQLITWLRVIQFSRWSTFGCMSLSKGIPSGIPLESSTLETGEDCRFKISLPVAYFNLRPVPKFLGFWMASSDNNGPFIRDSTRFFDGANMENPYVSHVACGN